MPHSNVSHSGHASNVPFQNVQRVPVAVSGAYAQEQINTAAAEQLRDSSSVAVLDQINGTVGETSYFFLITLCLGLLAFLVLIFGNTAIGALLGALTAGIGFYLHGLDVKNRTFPLFFELDDASSVKWKATCAALQALANSNKIWQIDTKTYTYDLKRNAGAGTIVQRKDVQVRTAAAPFIASNLEPYCIVAGGQTLVFFPDRLYVYENKRYGAVAYEALQLETGTTNFVETGFIPHDSPRVGTTWRYVNKSGGPDRRFNNNVQIPMMQYGVLSLKSATGLNLLFHVSSFPASSSFVAGIQTAIGRQGASGQTSAGRPGAGSGQAPPRPTAPRPPYLIELGLDLNCTKEQASSRYHELAKAYHPDLVSHLAPEFRLVAEERMKSINVAYAELKTARGW
ncbi:MAG TPA: J domain-containing protein [Fimbriimonadaceae bacterium]|jgi:hypothetical protein